MRVTEISAGIYDSLLVAEPRLEGDYNDNGVVDAADYVVWRNTLEQLVVHRERGADGFANGEITQLDYRFWKERFGNTLGSGSTETASCIRQCPRTRARLLLLLTATAIAAYASLRKRR